MVDSTILTNVSPLGDLAILFATATAVVSILHRFKLPEIVGLIFAGTIVGPYGLQWVAQLQSAEFLTEFGMVLLLFTIGLEITPDRMAIMRRSFLNWGPWQVAGTVGLAGGAAMYVGGLELQTSIYVGCLVSLSSTAIVTRVIDETRAESEPHANGMIGILIFQDLAVIAMLIALPLIASSKTSNSSEVLTMVWQWGGNLLGLGLVLWIFVKFVIDHVFQFVLATRSKGVFYFLVLSLSLGAAAIFHAAGFSASLGAFVLGLSLNRSNFRYQLVAELSLIKENLLNLFFISLGMLLDIRFVLDHYAELALVIFAVIVIKTFVIWGAGCILRYPSRLSLFVGLGLAHVGEFSFVLAQEANKLELLPANGFQFFLSASLISLLIAPFIYRFCFISDGRHRNESDFLGDDGDSQNDGQADRDSVVDAVIIGYGLAGRSLATAMQSLNLRYRIVEMNYDVVRRLLDEGEDAVFGDASRIEVLEEVLENAKLVVITAHGLHNVQRIVFNCREAAPLASIVVRVQYMADAMRLKLPDNAQIVVAEYETSLEVLLRVLHQLKVEQNVIDKIIRDSKASILGELPASLNSMTDASIERVVRSSLHRLRT
jgi:monovalent cation:H+ antiporter-2, CPA2 family